MYVVANPSCLLHRFFKQANMRILLCARILFLYLKYRSQAYTRGIPGNYEHLQVNTITRTRKWTN